MKITSTFFTLVFLTITTVGTSQTRLPQANDKYDKFAYVDAIKSYERIVDRGFKSAEILQKLGNSYYFNSDFDNAAKWYGELFTISENMPPEYYYRYAQSLKAVGNYDKSDVFMKTFARHSDGVSSQLIIENPDYLEQIKANSGRYLLENTTINTQFSDYGTTIYNNQLIFTSARGASFFSRKHSWTNENFTNLYSATIENDSLGTVQKFAKNTSSKFHESSAIFTKDGKTMYFTRNNYIDRKRGKNSEKVTLLQIYKSTIVDRNGEQTWSTPENVSFNSDNYSTAHPALSVDNKTMYFASDMPGTIGQSDIFSVVINADGSFGKPRNLGTTINTEGRESFPFVMNDELYFASDGRPGLGGLDIYISKIQQNSFSRPQNIGTPANSQKDDFAFFLDPNTRKGFLSSNRDGGKGNDDIYRITELKKLGCEQLLSGIVSDRLSREVLSNAILTLSDADFKIISTVQSDVAGKYFFSVNCDKKYYIKVEKVDYSTEETSVLIPNSDGSTNRDFELDKVVNDIKAGDDLAIILKLNRIYFDLDKSDIRSDAELELQRILDVLIQNPKLKLDIRSHTDSRQTQEYNLKLSEARAKSTLKYLVSKGIDEKRLSAKGYGESVLLNKCADGVECSEEQHQLNRRSEFIVISTAD